MDEQQAAISPEARREKDKLRKRTARAAIKQQKIAKEAAETYTSIEEWWAANLAKLTGDQRLGLEARQEYIADLMEVMDAYIDSTDGTTQADLDDLIAEVKADVDKYGFCCTAVLCIPRIWSEENADLRNRIAGNIPSGRSTPDLVNYGVCTAITERQYEDFRQRFMVERIIQPVEESILIRCESPNCADPGRSVPKSFIDRLKELKMQYLCHNCLLAGQRSAQQASINVFKKAERGGIYDSWGRVKL